jgi:hypothetical protein
MHDLNEVFDIVSPSYSNKVACQLCPAELFASLLVLALPVDAVLVQLQLRVRSVYVLLQNHLVSDALDRTRGV